MPSGLWWRGFDIEHRPLLLDYAEPPGPEPDPPGVPTVGILHPAPTPRLITGTAEPGAIVQVVISGVPFQTVVADSYGVWQVAFSGVPGLYSIEVRQQVGGLWSGYSAPMSFELLPEPLPPPSNYVPDRERGTQKDPDPQTPVTSLPGVGQISTPFRRPRAWPGEDH
ncbi:MAG: hypothetical protein IT480_10720 [Gammaproteobacteria bacterium]|nr:hypothetical protein [Gammaproteobacteria bacterium]